MTKSFSNREVGALVFLTMGGEVLSVTTGHSLAAGFLPGLLCLVWLAFRKGVALSDQLVMGWRGIVKIKEVILILSLIGIILPAWVMSGTVSGMVRLALVSMNAHYYLVLCFIMTMALSIVLGTSVGTLSALGIPLISTARLLGIPAGIVAGALVSGALVGDRTSPLSSSNQLLSHTLEIGVKRQFKNMLPTTVAGVLIVLTAFTFLERRFATGSAAVAGAGAGAQPFALIPYVPVIVLLIIALAGVNIRYAFMGSAAAAVAISLMTGVTPHQLLNSMWLGVKGISSGLSGMLSLVVFIAMASAYNGVLEELKVIQPLTDRWMGDAGSLPRSTIKTILGCLVISVITCSQTLPIILTGRSFLPHWKRGVGLDEYNRVMADSSMVMACLIPWSIHAVMCSTVLGVHVLAYLPYAWFPLAMPFITLAVSLIRSGRAAAEKSLESGY